MDPIPGPLGFLTSGYFFGLFVMAIVLNRIQNIVVPPRSSLAMRIHAARVRRDRWALYRMFIGVILPIDLSSTRSRALFRIPSVYVLAKSLLIWIVLLLQASHLFPTWKWDWLQSLGSWVSQKQMEDICWFTFTSTCVALAVGAFTNGLEGLHFNNNAPFNLFSFAFQLHIYASPSTHADKVPGSPSRPSKHVIITILLPLLQLTWLHCFEAHPRTARKRLLPTTVCSILTLVHFHTIFWRASTEYPLTNLFPCAVESLLLGIVLLAVGLSAASQLLAEGALVRPLLGHAGALQPRPEEDFATALVRMATAALEATRVEGLGNEVGSVTSARAAVAHLAEEAAVELDRGGAAIVAGGGRGFANEVRHVKARTVRGGDSWSEFVTGTGWLRSLGWFLLAAMRLGARLGRQAWRRIRDRGAPARAQPAVRVVPAVHMYQDEPDTDDDDADLYRRFLRGDLLNDEDDGEYQPPPDARFTTPFDDEDGEGDERAELYADLEEADVAPVLLAHMTSEGPLTRRRFGGLVAGARAGPDMSQGRVEDDERHVDRAHEEDPDVERRRNCVICTVEPREIICWPCRCLALCDDCRANLASRSAASKHTCPCCRRSVEGYSRIYIP
ncbi:hypothetical protein POSPLADRAFT_1044986 [Postia placenta MAD-698-R-SB12]|uniref:RING-type domain-containing protein n=1 Tax=Postia placenta MAD-698-R-SB12 TaxID=670580 RepID=A0A1X6NAK2_9APHY|nr:hypothetical protein POSPLADRAFT_1044986 [Postia placenta MAD-698-R-SB12]OSX65677.1 hypothetical protein POSPLADRAFT_1044986 [Postia placenta MAD-698-R-SB12]